MLPPSLFQKRSESALANVLFSSDNNIKKVISLNGQYVAII